MVFKGLRLVTALGHTINKRNVCVIKSLVKLLLKKAGYKITKIPKKYVRQPSDGHAFAGNKKKGFVNEIAKDPLNESLHLQYAFDALKGGKYYLAYAELKTALCLGTDREQVEKHIPTFIRKLPDLKSLGHNNYRRHRIIASEIRARGGKSNLSILDVGGGQGRLAAFLPDDYTYCLVEPTVNGISGTNLPFPDHSFDYVVSCHVLEHIPPEKRDLFLDQLLSKAKNGVLLLNPFDVDGTHVEERSKLFIEITGAQWAKEHLDCTLPKLDDIKSYAAKRGLEFYAKPDGTLTTGIAYVFVEYFAGLAEDYESLNKVNSFFNEKFVDITPSETNFSAYLVYIGWPKVGEQVQL